MVSSLAKQGIAPRSVLDVGANVGQFAVAALNLFPTHVVHCFEPQPDCVDQLKRNLKRASGVTVHPIALGAVPGEEQFHLNSHNHSSSFLRLASGHLKAFPGAVDRETIPVRISTLDLVFAGADLPTPVLLKLDVQGYESNVLRGGIQTLRRVDYVILEASLKPMYEGEQLFWDLAKLMESYGFSFLRPVSWLADPATGEYLQMDALFQRMT